MVLFPKTYTSAMRKTASMPANLSNIDLQQSVKRTQRDCEQYPQNQQAVPQTRREETANPRGQVVYYKPINLNQQLKKQAQQHQQEVIPKENKEYIYSKPDDIYYFRGHKVTYSDFVEAEYATLNDDYFMLDYIDNKYKNKNY